MVVYVYHKEKNHQALSFCSVSPCNIHQPAAIWAHLHPVLTNILENHSDIDTIHFFSDGPFSQYRQKANVFLACTKTFEYSFNSFSWSFFEAGHGKGPADGIGGYLKREADRKVATGTDITNAFEFYQVLRGSSKVNLFYITKEEIDAVQQDIPKNLLPLPGTKEVHQVFSRICGQLKYRNLSCFCTRGFCACLHPKVYSPIPAKKKNTTHTCEDIPRDDDFSLSPIPTPKENTILTICGDISSDDDLPLSHFLTSNKDNISIADLQVVRNKNFYQCVYGSSDDDENYKMQPSTSGQNNELPGIGDFLLVKVYTTKGKSFHTYACIAQSDIEEDGEIKVVFLKCVKGGKIFVIDEKDVSYVAHEDIIKKLDFPDIQRKRGVDYYIFLNNINVFEK